MGGKKKEEKRNINTEHGGGERRNVSSKVRRKENDMNEYHVARINEWKNQKEWKQQGRKAAKIEGRIAAGMKVTRKEMRKEKKRNERIK